MRHVRDEGFLKKGTIGPDMTPCLRRHSTRMMTMVCVCVCVDVRACACVCARVCVCVCFTIDLRSTHDVPIKPIAICYSGSSGLSVLLCEHLFPEHTPLFRRCVCVCAGVCVCVSSSQD